MDRLSEAVNVVLFWEKGYKLYELILEHED
jgi:hypothetical protein